jgi:hypothetical protein
MAEQPTLPWEPQETAIVPNTAHTPGAIIAHARQLSRREVAQVLAAFQSEHYEMATAFVWAKAMASLQKQLGALGMEFIGEMLQRPDIAAGSNIGTAITAFETIALAEDLGMVTSTEAMRLRHAHEMVNHFAALSEDEEDASMHPEEAIACLRTCVQNILGHPKLEVAQNFARFRKQLEEEDFDQEGNEMEKLAMSPYFYQRTTLSILLSLLKTAKGAQLQHAVRNIGVILPLLWSHLKKPERWQAGQAYAELYSEGKTQGATGLKKALVDVKGFDYVPENLRSSTFTQAAKQVLEAHEGMNNYYNEPAPMRTLASLGTTIPSPALRICMEAALSVWLGNSYGISWAAQDSARQLLGGLSSDRWHYYLEECLPYDRRILYKLADSGSKPQGRWADLVKEFDLVKISVKRATLRSLLQAGSEGHIQGIGAAAMKIVGGFQR